MSGRVSRIPQIGHHHLFQGLPPELLDDPKWAKHVVEGTRGRGYWFWKPALFNLMVRKGVFQNGDIVVWADADIKREKFEGFDNTTWPEALACFGDPGLDFFGKVQKRFCEKEWTKGDIFQRFGVEWSDPRYGRSGQVWAQFWIARVSSPTRRLMEMWEDLMADYHLCSDESSVAPNAPGFNENRHDQSMLSMLVKAQAPHHNGLGCKSALLEPWEKHTEFGIPGLKARLGDALSDLKCQASSNVALFGQSAASMSPPQRTVCILGQCFDLETGSQLESHTKGAAIDLHAVTG